MDGIEQINRLYDEFTNKEYIKKSVSNDLFGALDRIKAIDTYMALCQMFDNVWGKPLPPLEEQFKITDKYHMRYEDDEIFLYFSISFNNDLQMWYIVKKCIINGNKSNRKGLKRFIN